MKAIRVHSYGGPEVMQVEELSIPEPGSGQALVKLVASGVNFIDVYHRSGLYHTPLPFTPGSEGAGTVVAVGPAVSEVAVGDAVAYAMVMGSYAEYAVVKADRLVRVPAGVDVRMAAAVMLQGMTAHYLTHSTYPLAEGEACLVHAAAGGVGELLVQVAKWRGARVIGTVSTPEKERLARSAGADEVIRYSEQDFAVEVRRLTGGRGVRVVYDGVGQATFDKGLECLAPRGYMVLFGQSSGPVAPVDPQILNAKGSLFLTRPSLAHYVLTRDELLERAGAILGWLGSGDLKVHVGVELPLDQAGRAHELLQSRRTTGKVLLDVSTDGRRS